MIGEIEKYRSLVFIFKVPDDILEISISKISLN